MQKILIKQPGGLDNLQLVDADLPEPGVGEVRVRWRASSLNYHDLLVANGAIPVAQDRVPMSDGAGEIDTLGDGVSDWQIGDKVMSLFFPGWIEGAASPKVGMSIFGLQFAKAAGAYVYATTSSDRKAERLIELGADEVVNYQQDEKWGKTIAKRSGGIDHILDVGGPSTLAQSVEAVAYQGQISLIGILGGRKAEVVLPKLFFKHASLNGIAVGSRAMQADMVKAINVSGMQAVIDRSFELSQIKEAFEYQLSGQHFGKIILEY